ncbi:Uncharacterized protein TSPI_11169 [Trichinella spiralis]|uniref:Uncharacterized protein n=1 Tax=Trichinella spiralis TaxID=6334 RepID=A0ABR3KBX5_TRISP
MFPSKSIESTIRYLLQHQLAANNSSFMNVSAPSCSARSHTLPTLTIFTYRFEDRFSLVVNQCSSTEKSPTHYFERGKPNWDQLQHVIYRLSETVPTFFLRRLDYTFYSDDVLFLNRICGSEVKGLRNYWLHLATLSVLSRIPCPYIEMKVLNCMPIVEEGSVHLRWRVLYLTVPEFLYVVVRERSADIETLRKNARWFDGFSHFYVGSDGLVYKHVADRVMRDPEEIAANSKRRIATFVQKTLLYCFVQKIWKQFNLDKEKKSLPKYTCVCVCVNVG